MMRVSDNRQCSNCKHWGNEGYMHRDCELRDVFPSTCYDEYCDDYEKGDDESE